MKMVIVRGSSESDMSFGESRTDFSTALEYKNVWFVLGPQWRPYGWIMP